MPSAYIIWDRKAQNVVCSGGVPLIFPTSNDATAHVAGTLDGKRGNSVQKTYDVLTVTVA